MNAWYLQAILIAARIIGRITASYLFKGWTSALRTRKDKTGKPPRL